MVIQTFCEHFPTYEFMEFLRASEATLVFRAQHHPTNCSVAIKLLHAPDAHPQATARFEREINALQGLNHCGIVRLIEARFDESIRRADDGIPYFATEFLTGTNLERLLRDCGPLSDGRALLLMKQAAQALSAIHEMGWIHRDIKPANLMLTAGSAQGEQLTVIDFGLAQIWQPAASDAHSRNPVELGVAGTPAYLSPEVAQPPRAIDPRSDIYSLGCVGYCLLTGQPPFTGHNPIEISWKQIYQPPIDLLSQLPEPSRTSQALAELIMRCLAKNPLERPQSAFDLLHKLQQIEPISPWTARHAISWWDANQPSRS